jgi:hypothetical protein
MIPFHHWCVFFQYVKEPKKNPELFVVQGLFLYIWWYDYILLRTLNLRQSCPLIVNHDWPTFVGRLLTLCVEFCFIVFLLNINCFTKVIQILCYVKFFIKLKRCVFLFTSKNYHPTCCKFWNFRFNFTW